MLKEKRYYTAEDYFAMTDKEGRFELIDGELYDMSPAPSLTHQDIVLDLGSEIKSYIRRNKGGCRVYVAPADVMFSKTDVVQPDVFVVCDRDKLDGNRCNGAPDWIIEVLSPSDSTRDTKIKLDLYRRFGVREYWIVDPEAEKVTVHIFGTNTIGIYSFGEPVPVWIYSGEPEPLEITVSKE